MNIQEEYIIFKKENPVTTKLDYEPRAHKSFFLEKSMPVAMQWVWSLLWMFLLIMLVWPLSFMASVLYITIIPFTACCECTYQLTEFLHKGINLPQLVATYVVAGRSCAGL